MIKILAIQTKEEQKELCGVCGIRFRADALAYKAFIDDEFVGMSQFGIKDKNGYLYDLKPAPSAENYENALYIMGRGLLSFLETAGVYDAYVFDNAEIPRELSARVGFFPNDDGKLYIDLRGQFEAK